MSDSNPFASGAVVAKDPFKTAQSCLSNTTTSASDASKKVSSFAAFSDAKEETCHDKSTQDPQMELCTSKLDNSVEDSTSTDTEYHNDSDEEYISLDAINTTSHCEMSKKGQSTTKIVTRRENFKHAIEEVDTMVEEMTRSFQRLRKLTDALSSRKTSSHAIIPIPDSRSEKPVILTGATAKNYFNFHYPDSSEKQSGVDSKNVAKTVPKSLASNDVPPVASSAVGSILDKVDASLDSGVKTEPLQVAEKSEKVGNLKDTSATKTNVFDGKKQESAPGTLFSTKGETSSPSKTTLVEGKATGSSLLAKGLSQPFPEVSAADSTKKTSTDVEYPFQPNLSGSWNCWRCRNSLDSDKIVGKIKDTGAQHGDLVGKSYFLITCDSSQCLGTRRRYYFIPTGKEPILHKDVQQTVAMSPTSVQSDNKMQFGNQPSTSSTIAVPAFGGSMPTSSAANAFSVSSGNASASKQEANSFFMQNIPKQTVETGNNPFLNACTPFAQQGQSNASQPQFGVRSAISSSFNTQQPNNSASASGPIFGNSRFQNFENTSTWGNAPRANSLWGQSSSHNTASATSNQQTGQDPNTPLNPFTRPSAFSNMK